MANLSKTLHINFYQNQSSIIEVMIKKFGVFLCLTVYFRKLLLLVGACENSMYYLQNIVCSKQRVFIMFLSVFTGRALIEAGESYKQLAEIKYSVEDNVKQNFLEPLQNLQNKDLKEVNVCVYLIVCFLSYYCVTELVAVNFC